jgi:hypothetical protein
MNNKDMIMTLLAMKYSLEKSRKDVLRHVERVDESMRVLEVMLQKLEVDKYTTQTFINPVDRKKKGVI